MNASAPFSDHNYSNYGHNSFSSSTTMDTQSVYSSDISEGLSHDTFEIARRARQDVLMSENRLDRGFSSRRLGGGGVAPDFSFPSSTSAAASLDPVNTHHHHNSICLSSNIGIGGSKRKVSFAGQKVINEGADEWIEEDEMHTRWWSQDDLEDIKKSAKEMSLKLRKLAKEKGCYVETAHKKTSLMLTNDFQELVKMSASSPDQDLTHWCARSDGRRGLERFACRDYGNVRKSDVLGTRRAVFQEQDRQRRSQAFVPEALAKVSKAMSRRSRTFSLFMGEADAQGVARGVTRSRSKRVKVSHSTKQQQQQKQQEQRRAPPRSFSSHVDAPLLTSSA